MKTRIQKMLKGESGQGMTEYMIIAILVGLVVLFAVNRFGGALFNRFETSTQAVGDVNIVDEEGQDVFQEN